MRAIVASPSLAYRQVLAAIARDAGMEPTVISLSADAIGELTKLCAKVLVLHHEDAEVAARLAKHAKDRGMTVVVIANRPEDRRAVLGSCAVALAGTANWNAVVEAIRGAAGRTAAMAV